MTLTVRNLLGKQKRSSSPGPPTQIHTRSSHELYKPAPLPKLEHPGNTILPCGCSRSHALVSKLDTVKEDSYPGKISSFTSTSGSPRRGGDDFQFNYYLPHISDSITDFYTEQYFMVFDVNGDEEVEKGTAEQLELPFIHEDDFQYYPSTTDFGSQFSDSTDESPETRVSLTRARLTKKGAREEFRLERMMEKLVKKLSMRS
ncbi:hypothetical protein K469DRAFT_721489 [Zopfia rhizophila CBS 207.26]|uniref:Uncharacterized protein n=1 Tax=Zopfia rhizophila CBS 207.26 TaxID=1314779 RepID=A0A6A6EIR0_9PEZI|nr:hypothetical protein K469DRAFT_721489 [Zopfia rhizophila CBS 207.26]